MNLSIRTKMILLIVPAIIIILTVSTIVSLHISSEAQEEMAYRDTSGTARAYANDFNTQMKGHLAIPITLANVLEQDTSLTREEVLDILHKLLQENPNIVGIDVGYEPDAFDMQDTRYASTPGHDSTGRFLPYWNRLNGSESLDPMVDMDTSDWYTIPKRTKKDEVIEPLLYEGVLMTSFISPITKNGTFHGIVGMDVTLDNIDSTVSQVRVFDTGYAFLVSNNGTFVSCPEKSYIGKRSLLEVSRDKNNQDLTRMASDIRNGTEGYLETTDPFTQKRVVMFYSPISTGNWSMVVVAPQDEMLAGVAMMGRIMILIGIISTLLTGGIVVMVARNISGPVISMSRSADKIAAGNLNIRVPEQEGELGVLARAFNNMTSRLRETIELLERQVCELEEAQDALQESERKCRAIFDQTFQFIGLLSPDGTVLEANRSAMKFGGIKEQDVIGKPFWDTIWWAHSEELQETLRTAVKDAAGGKFIRFDATHRAADGCIHNIDFSLKPVMDESGKVILIIPEGRDVTERIKAENALSESETLYRTIFEDTGAATMIIDKDTTIIRANSEFVRLSGYPIEEIEGKLSWTEFVGGEDLERMKQFHHGRRGDPSAVPKVYDFTFVTRNGSARYCINNVAMIPGTTTSVASIIDITERKAAEDALARATMKLNILNSIAFSEIQNAIFILNGYIHLEKQLPVDDIRQNYLHKQANIIQRISDSLTFVKNYQDLGIKPPAWQSVLHSFLFAVSHLDMQKYSREISVAGLEIYADPLLEKVFLTLAENVILHATKATRVSLTYRETQDGLVIIFEDNGAGVPVSMKEKIFEHRFEEKKGMGLFLSREILSITKISIRETGHPGEGARFEILVPKGSYRFTSGM